MKAATPKGKPYRYRFGDKSNWVYVTSHIACVSGHTKDPVRLVECGVYTGQRLIEKEWVTIIRINLDGFWKNESGYIEREYT